MKPNERTRARQILLGLPAQARQNRAAWLIEAMELAGLATPMQSNGNQEVIAVMVKNDDNMQSWSDLQAI